MASETTFDQVLDAIELLPDDQQANLVEVVRRRLAERGRQQIIADAQQARAEHQDGRVQPISVDELMRELES
jgi:hypothetical protein